VKMQRYKAHQSYEESGVLSCLMRPVHWSSTRLKFFSELNPSKLQVQHLDPRTSVTFLPMEAIGESGELDVSRERALGDVRGGYTFLAEGDVCIAKITPCFENGKGAVISGTLGGVAFATTEVIPFRCIRSGDARFLFYVLTSAPFHTDAEASMYGAGGQKRVADSFAGNYAVLLPPSTERTQITKFLDYETAKIDALIDKQQQLIALLKEKRQAVISHAVTKGLNPDAAMRDSGVEWLGEVPAHWTVHCLRFCATGGRKTFTDGDWIESPSITKSGIRLLQTGNVGIGKFREKGFRYISEESFRFLKCTEIHPNDVLVCRLDGPVGRACLVPDLGVRMITSVDNTILKVREGFDPRYLVYLMSSSQWISWIENICRAGGGFRFRVSRTMLGSQRVPVPSAEEQTRIADLLDEGKGRFRQLLAAAEEGIGLLQERRTALISAAVTGKIDVRTWTPSKPTPSAEVA